eukprot:g13370.t1
MARFTCRHEAPAFSGDKHHRPQQESSQQVRPRRGVFQILKNDVLRGQMFPLFSGMVVTYWLGHADCLTTGAFAHGLVKLGVYLPVIFAVWVARAALKWQEPLQLLYEEQFEALTECVAHQTALAGASSFGSLSAGAQPRGLRLPRQKSARSWASGHQSRSSLGRDPSSGNFLLEHSSRARLHEETMAASHKSDLLKACADVDLVGKVAQLHALGASHDRLADEVERDFHSLVSIVGDGHAQQQLRLLEEYADLLQELDEALTLEESPSGVDCGREGGEEQRGAEARRDESLCIPTP